MKQLIFAIVSMLLCSTVLSAGSTSKESITLHTIMLSGDYRSELHRLVNQFNNSNSDIQLNYIVSLNDDYHVQRERCLIEKVCDADIYLGFAGYSFEQEVEAGYIADISDLWDEAKLDTGFANLKAAMTIDQKQYAVPVSYYPWGFFYKKSLFERLNLTEPDTWQEFIKICEVLADNNISPITIGTKTPFPAASWFSYLNLRLHGLEFHTQLTAGNISYYDKRVRQTLTFLKQLIDKGYFLDRSDKLSYTDALPFLYQERAGLYLMGNIIISSIPDEIVSDFSFFRFPIIDPAIPVFEEAPLDLFYIPITSKYKTSAKRVLAFFTDANNIFGLNKASGYLSPNTTSPRNSDPLLEDTSGHLKQSAGFSYFFNRNSPPEIGRAGTKLLGQFITNPDIDLLISEMESLRKSLEN